MPALVSILIPAFNAERWLAETIRSATAQTWPRKEVIVVVDEGCKDGTLAVAKRMSSREVLVTTRPHQCASGARNSAFSVCQGDYIQWLDADDLLSPDKVALQMKEAQRHQDDRLLLSCAWGSFMFRPSRARFESSRLWCDLSPDEWVLRKMGENLHMQPGTWLASRSLTEAIGPWGVALLDEDGEYFNRLVLASSGIRFVPDAKVYYRLSGFNSYTSRSNLRWEGRWSSIQLQLGQLRSLGDSPRMRTAYLNYLQTWLIYFYPEAPEVVARLEQFAEEAGSKLDRPSLRWKYAWLGRLFGYGFGKRAQFFLPEVRWSIARFFDRVLLPVDRIRSV
jgi:glycosyltransferase involved in cell wall biosynthesis